MGRYVEHSVGACTRILSVGKKMDQIRTSAGDLHLKK